jgi:hypothetical protein
LPAKDKLIVALDVETPIKALELVKELRSVAGMFKVGSPPPDHKSSATSSRSTRKYFST